MTTSTLTSNTLAATSSGSVLKPVKPRDSLLGKYLLPAPEFALCMPDNSDRNSVEEFVGEKFRKTYGADVHEFFPCLLNMKCLGKLTGVAGLRPAGSDALFLEQYLDYSVEQELSDKFSQKIARNSIVEIGNLVADERGASHLVFLVFTAMLHSAGYKWIVFTATRSLQNNLTKLGFNMTCVKTADQGRLTPDAQQDWGTYYDTGPVVVAGQLVDAMAIILARPLYRRVLRLYRKQITLLAEQFGQARCE